MSGWWGFGGFNSGVLPLFGICNFRCLNAILIPLFRAEKKAMRQMALALNNLLFVRNHPALVGNVSHLKTKHEHEGRIEQYLFNHHG
jgi:hypothetical protein